MPEPATNPDALPSLSDREREVMLHALGLVTVHGRKRWAHRNRFVATHGSPDDVLWSGLEGRGLALSWRSTLAPKSRFYEVMEAGMRALGVLNRVPREHRRRSRG